MPFKFHPDTSSREVPHLDPAVFGPRGKKIRVPGTKDGVLDSILIFEQHLIFPSEKVPQRERLPVVEQERIAIEKQHRADDDAGHAGRPRAENRQAVCAAAIWASRASRTWRRPS
jgi:hypothetical protein